MSASPRRALKELSAIAVAVSNAPDVDEVSRSLLEGLRDRLGIAHSLVMILDEVGEQLFTIASLGYDESGVGSEIAVGDGVIGTVAKRRRPLRMGNLGRELSYGRAVREASIQRGDAVGRQIRLPGLPRVESILAVPMLTGDELRGVLSAESERPGAFLEMHEHAFVLLAHLAAARLTVLDEDADRAEEPAGAAASSSAPTGPQRKVVYYPEDDSVFVDHDYIIKSLPGRILWKLLTCHEAEGRRDFTNLELRRDASLKLPAYRDNLESRLLLLRRRLAEKSCGFHIEKTGRGRFRLVVEEPLLLDAQPGG